MIAQSVYVSNFDKDYLQNIKNRGINNIFISLHVTEELEESDKLEELLNYLTQNKFEIIADVSPVSLKHFTFKQLKALNINTLRIDYGMSNEEIVKLSKDFNIILNASTVTEESLSNLNKLGLDFSRVKAMHNFYPKEETGLDLEIFLRRNQKFIDNNISVIAFITGDEEYRGPLYKGLPTLEKHRNILPYIQYLELSQYINEIYIADPKISEEQLKNIIDAENGIINIIVDTYDNSLDELLNKKLTIREDSNNILLRIEESRTTYKKDFNIKPNNIVDRKVGDITIDNEKALRYNGEVMIMLQDKPKNEDRNVVGKINNKYIDITDVNLNGKKIKLINSKN